VLIVAHNQARRIAATVRASRAIPGVDLVLVVDDGSADNTQHLARKAGAVVVRHSHRRGRSVSIETGAAVIGMRDEAGKTPRAVLLMEPGLGNAAIGAAPLVAAVLESVADMAIGLTDGGSRSTGVSAASARKAIASLSGWSPIQPLSRVRCATREALEAALPLSHGAGLETGMTLDVIDAGLTVTEVECEMRHRAHKKTDSRPLARVGQYRDVMIAISSRRIRLSLRSTQHAAEDTFHIASRSGGARGPGAKGASE
jgi:glycosyltransferase involved in cell wall biosynthesis